MRPGPWLLLLLLSLPASALAQPGAPSLRRRTLVAPSRPSAVPPLPVLLSPGVATFLQLDASLASATPRLPVDEARIQLLPAGGGSWVLVPSPDLPEGARVPLTVDSAPGAEPLRFSLVSQRDAVDVQVRVVLAAPSSEEDSAELLAQHLLDSPEARVTHLVPQKQERRPVHSRVELRSVLWMGRRFFATVLVRRQKSAPRWHLVQVRLRVTLADGSLQEWPARLLSGAPGDWRQRHVFTGLLPEGASRPELALDGEDAPGGFQPLPEDEEPGSP